MPRLALASSDQIDALYRESHALWGAGLTLRDYREVWSEMADIPWARAHLRYLVWIDDDENLLSSLKLYRPRARLLGRHGRVTGIGAVFTPRRRRKRGHASEMIRRVLAEARQRGDLAALLFSDVGTGFYGALGFSALPAQEAWGEIRRPPPPPAGWSLRPLEPAHFEDVLRVHAEGARTRRFAIIRDAEYWQFLLERSRRFFARLDGSDLSLRFQVALRDGVFAGHLVTVDSGDVWIVREVEACGEDPAAVAAILSLGAGQARSRGLRRLYAWLPRELAAALRGFRVQFGPRTRAIPMIQRLDGGPARQVLGEPGTVFIPYLDQF